LVPEAAKAARPAQDTPGQLRALESYFSDIRRHALLSRQEEHRVAARYADTKDPKLAARLVNANLRLVVKLALGYRASRRNLTDLIQEGNLGLLHAVHKYDPHRGIKLATYAAWWIRAYMLQFIISNARIVRIATTQHQRKLFFGLGRARAHLEGSAGAGVGTADLAAAFSVPERTVVEMQSRLGSQDASLDGPAHTDDDRDRMDCLGDGVRGADAELADHEARRLVKRAMRTFALSLTGRDRVIFQRRLLCEERATLRTIADTFGVSRERVRQLESGLKARLRAHLEATLGNTIPDLAGGG
jgi:RNA polymerase sigma-32 factor